MFYNSIGCDITANFRVKFTLTILIYSVNTGHRLVRRSDVRSDQGRRSCCGSCRTNSASVGLENSRGTFDARQPAESVQIGLAASIDESHYETPGTLHLHNIHGRDVTLHVTNLLMEQCR